MAARTTERLLVKAEDRTAVPRRLTEEVHTDARRRRTVEGPMVGLRRARCRPTVEASVGLQHRPMVAVLELPHTVAAAPHLLVAAVDTQVDSAVLTQADSAAAVDTRPLAVAATAAVEAEVTTADITKPSRTI